MMTNECPFSVGKKYESLTRIEELGHIFDECEIMVFRTSAYDPHNGVTRFWFAKDGDAQMNVWHVWDTDPPASEQWTKYFRLVDWARMIWMNQILICLLTLLFSLSGSAIGKYSDFWQSSNAARGVGIAADDAAFWSGRAGQIDLLRKPQDW
jgi:hypothetical protein